MSDALEHVHRPTGAIALQKIEPRCSTANPVRIGLLGMYASRNLGDVAIQLAVMKALRTRRPDLEFVGLCQDPADTLHTFGISAYSASGYGRLLTAENAALELPTDKPPPRSIIPAWISRLRSLRNIHRQMKTLDMLLISGSGQIDDFWGGAWAQPFRLMAWSNAARRQRKPVAAFGIGVDELTTRLGTWFCLRALECTRMCMLRDSGSEAALLDLGYSGVVEVCADPAFHLTCPRALTSAQRETSFAVISPISRDAWPGEEDQSYREYLDKLAAVADHLQQQSLQVRFVCSQIRMDPPVVQRIKQKMRGDVNAAVFIEVNDVDAYFRGVQGAKLLVGSRLHALILALVAGVPSIAISGVRKVHQQFEDLGLSDQVFGMRSLSTTELLAKVDMVIQNYGAARQHILGVTQRLRLRLDERFDSLAALIPAQPIGHDGP